MNGNVNDPAAPRAGNKNQFLWLATAVLMIAAVLRLVLLSEIPPGLSQDEVLNADIVSFIRQGEQAIFFSHGYGHEALYHYFSVPFQLLLGDNVLSIRLPAVILGLLLIAITMRWARRDFGLPVALVAGTGLAISWWPIIFSRVGLRPILAAFLLVSAVWFWNRRPWLAGALLGLTIYSYTASRYIFLLPLAFFVYLLLFHRQRGGDFRSRPHGWANPRTALIVFLVSFAFFIPLAVTLQLNPELQQRVGQLSGPLEAFGQGDLGPLRNTIRATLGVFSFTGDPRWTYTIPGRPIFDILTAIFFYGGAVIVLWRWRQAKYAFLILWFGLALLPSALSPDAPSTIRLIGILPLVYLAPGIAVDFLLQQGDRRGRRFRERGRLKLFLPFLLLLALVVGINLWRTVQDGFVRWPNYLEARVKYQSVLQDMASYWQDEPVKHLVIAEAFFEPIDAASFNRNLGSELNARWVQTGKEVAGALVIPAGDEAGQLYVPEFAPPKPELLDAAGLSNTPVYRSENRPSFAVYQIPSVAPMPDQKMGVALEDMLTLVGYSELERIQDQIHLVTYWRVDSPTIADPDNVDIAAFIHLVGADNLPIRQHDGMDAALQTLQAGDTILQYHVLELPDPLPQGPLTLQIGLYHRNSGQRLLHEGQPADRIILDFD